MNFKQLTSIILVAILVANSNIFNFSIIAQTQNGSTETGENVPVYPGSVEENATAPEWAMTPNPSLPNVLILGDSISAGYTLSVRKHFENTANIYRPVTKAGTPDNCGSSSNYLYNDNLDKWLKLAPTWDVIHFNAGLHDLKRVDPNNANLYNSTVPTAVDIESYKSNLRLIVDKLKATGATIIFATTTPTVSTSIPAMLPEDVISYNNAALEVMDEKDIIIDDLYTGILPNQTEMQWPNNCHFNDSGNLYLGGLVSTCLESNLKQDKINRTNMNKLISECQNLNRTTYTNESLVALDKALADAILVQGNSAATRSEVNIATYVLQKARESMEVNGFVWIKRPFVIKESDFTNNATSVRLNPRLYWNFISTNQMPLSLSIKEVKIETVDGSFVERYTTDDGLFVSNATGTKNLDYGVTLSKGTSITSNSVRIWSNGYKTLGKGNHSLIISVKVKISDSDNLIGNYLSIIINLFNSNNQEITNDMQKIATGMNIKFYQNNTLKNSCPIVIYGDVSGDGAINVSDLAALKNHLLKSTLLSGAYEKAGDLSKKGKITISDLIAVKKQILGM